MRKRVCREGFVNRAITLLNMAGTSFQHECSEKESKKLVNEWVNKNIDIKPKPTSKNIRFLVSSKETEYRGRIRSSRIS